MASNVSVSTGHELTIDDLRDVYTALITFASNFRYIGLEINVPPHILNEIDRDKYDSKEKLYSVLEYRLKQRIPLTWEDIVRALRSPAVNESALASQIEYNYLPHSSSQSVPTPVPPVSDTSNRPGPSHQPSHPQQLLHSPSYQPCKSPNDPQPLIIHSHNQLPTSSGLVTEPAQPRQLNRTEQDASFTSSQLLQLQHLLSSLAPVSQQQYQPHVQPPFDQVHFPRPMLQTLTQPPHWQTPHQQRRHSLDSMQYGPNDLYPFSNDSQQSQSPEQPTHTVSTSSQYHGPQQVSLHEGQSLSPTPLTKRPRLEPRASSRQQSVPPPPPASSTLVASHTPTSQESIQTSSLQHVQSVDSSSSGKAYSEAMANFNQYIKNIYKSRKVEIFVKFSLNPTKVYINLALIDRDVAEHKEYKDITVAMVQDGNVDVIQEKKERIKLDKIASGIPNPNTESGKLDGKTLILVEGAPGVGKSTFAWEFCRRWLQGIIAMQYDLVLLLRLRDERIRTAKCLKDLLYIPLPGVLEQVLQEIVLGKCNVLLILEGYDELPDGVRKDSSSVFNQLISGELLPLATILVTSRPWATEGIRKHQSRLYQHIEVLGFTKRQIREYIKATVPAENINELMSYLERHPQIRSGMYIPINSAIVVAVYLASQRGTQPLPKTQTELYTSLVNILIGRHIESYPQLKESTKVQIHFLGGISLPVKIHKHLVDLSKLAYKGIVESSEEVKLIFSESDLPKDFDNLGFMDSVTDLYLNQEMKSSHNFLHLTFQEFFAATYISIMPPEKQREYYHDNVNKKGGRLNVVLRFLSGLKKLDYFTEGSAFLVKKRSQYVPPCEFISPPECMIGIDVTNWMFEAQSEDKISMILGERKVEFKAKKVNMTPMDYYSLGYCISHSQCQWVLSLTGRMAISKEKIGILVEGATGSGFNGRVVEFTTDVITNLSKTVFNALFNNMNRFLCLQVLPAGAFEDTTLLSIISSTSKLILCTCNARLNYKPITEALLKNQLLSLKELRFQDIVLKSEAAQYLVQFLENTKMLNHFSLVMCEVPAHELFVIVEIVHKNPVIKGSEIRGCKLYDDDFQYFNQLIKYLDKDFVQAYKETVTGKCHNVAQFVRNKKTLDLSNGKLITFSGGNSKKFLLQSLHQNSVLEELNISNNEEYLNETGVKDLTMALQDGSSLKILNVSWNYIGTGGALSLSEALDKNKTLEELDLSYCKICDDGAISLSRNIGRNSSLKVLKLECNGIKIEGTAALARALSHNCTLLHLDLSWNKIGDQGCKSLSKTLTCNSTLKELKLSKCEIGDESAMVLSEDLYKNSTLEVMDLSLNRHIGHNARQALITATKCNSICLHIK